MAGQRELPMGGHDPSAWSELRLRAFEKFVKGQTPVLALLRVAAGRDEKTLSSMLLLTGLYLFMLPYATSWRNGRRPTWVARSWSEVPLAAPGGRGDHEFEVRGVERGGDTDQTRSRRTRDDVHGSAGGAVRQDTADEAGESGH
jgi:hypothetical protein